ncbi:hypothetical protein J4E86_004280 [Alternaria arbusti]|uniref:uncharacterized protein n=1 Tax=Alternaria arbusti TaxID=232088 RepID=UPI00222075DB|nr:uncharacterized protein J4E86_004280 [Alternaria arbusti]KAI4958675.1 hypothetical protein J4E86_004280 [Alternaria arbusti]
MEGVGNATTLLEIEPETKHLVSRILPIVIPVFIAILLVSSRRSSYDAARVGKSRWWSLIPGQFHKALGKPFISKVFGWDYLLMPPRYLDDVRKADEDDLSFAQCFSEAFNVHVSAGDVYASKMMPDAVKQYLNPQLPSLVETMKTETDHILAAELNVGDEWKTVQVFSTFTEMAHRITCRILLGEDLARDKVFIEESQLFNRSLFISAILVNGIALGPFRNLVAWLTAIKHRTHLSRCIKYLILQIEKVRAQSKDYNNAVKWMLELAEGDEVERNPDRMAKQLMHLMFAGSSAPGGLVVQMVYQILMSPEYLEPLRAEISRTLEETGGFTASFVSRTPLMESFVRETMRLYPTGVVSVTRAVRNKPFSFSDGYTLPAGSHFAFPIQAIQRDPENYQDPLTFRGFRFATQTDEKEVNASTVDKTFLTDTADLIGQVDFPKLERSGLGAQFWSAYVECPRDGGDVNDQGTYYESMHQTLQQMDLINRLIDAYPERLQRASSAAEVWSQFAKSKASNAGRDVVLEMNRLGLMVDLSHTSVATQRDAFNASRAPVVYTHSSARALCDHPRNVADEELWALKAKRGIIMVNFFPGFVTCSVQAALKDVADHIIYLGELIGFEHVGIGADFDGMGFDSGPAGLEDVGTYPALIEELLRRGVSVADVCGVAGANILRVLAEVEQVARDLNNQQPLEDRVKSIF